MVLIPAGEAIFLLRNVRFGTIVIIIFIGSTALVGTWSPQANVASDFYPEHPPANFYNPVSLRLPLSRQSILISVGHVLVDLQGLSTTSFFVNEALPVS